MTDRIHFNVRYTRTFGGAPYIEGQYPTRADADAAVDRIIEHGHPGPGDVHTAWVDEVRTTGPYHLRTREG